MWLDLRQIAGISWYINYNVCNCLKKDTLSQIIFQETPSCYGEHDIRRLRAYMFCRNITPKGIETISGWTRVVRKETRYPRMFGHTYTYIFRSSNLYFL